MSALVISVILFSSILLSHPNNNNPERSANEIKKSHSQYRFSRYHEKGLFAGALFDLRHQFSKLNLSTAQREQLKILHESHRDSTQEGWKAIKPLSSEMRGLLHAPSFDETAFRLLAERVSKKRIDQLLLMALLKRKALKILTMEQKKQLEKNSEHSSWSF